ncbi:hypothetical protein GCM10022204_44410 [Microlunatus aurantiacus]|uniref:non-specific serine/threonine protein kinase n=2 Tax=Microlunatus aurantiacus TaxID=446786 RepID=A0ABP7EHV8_9ACTN
MGKSPYKRLRELGAGGFAHVWLAEDLTGSHVALKEPKSVPNAAKRMRREIELMRRFANKHVMQILDYDEYEPWFVMPVAEGNLGQLLRIGGLGLDPESVALDIVEAAAAGLGVAHSEGVVHRDVSPGNMLLLRDTSDGTLTWVVADWGLVRRPLGQTTSAVTQSAYGTPGYAAPETWDDMHAVDARADVYSVGRLVAQILTGRTPIWNTPLLPAGRMRGFVADCTDQNPDLRPADLNLALGEMKAVLGRPAVRPRARLRDLLANEHLDSDAFVEVRRLVRQNFEDQKLFIDDLPEISVDLIEQWVGADPDEAAEVAINVCRHLQSGEWGTRHFNYANVPLLLVFNFLRSLVQATQFALAEDVATNFFRAEASWTRFEQQKRTNSWLAGLDGQAGQAMARAVRRSGEQEYYRQQLRRVHLKSPDLDEEIG